jgi:hypothetical protein
VPKDEHSNIGSAERAIDEIDRMVAASLLRCLSLNQSLSLINQSQSEA